MNSAGEMHVYNMFYCQEVCCSIKYIFIDRRIFFIFLSYELLSNNMLKLLCIKCTMLIVYRCQGASPCCSLGQEGPTLGKDLPVQQGPLRSCRGAEGPDPAGLLEAHSSGGEETQTSPDADRWQGQAQGHGEVQEQY